MITDYGLYRAWLADETDAYVVACGEMIAELCTAGVNREKILLSVIPIRSGFEQTKQQTTCRAQLKFLPDLPLVLMMVGSFGVDKVTQMYQAAVLEGDHHQSQFAAIGIIAAIASPQSQVNETY